MENKNIKLVTAISTIIITVVLSPTIGAFMAIQPITFTGILALIALVLALTAKYSKNKQFELIVKTLIITFVLTIVGLGILGNLLSA